MTTLEEITIRVDPEAAKIYRSASAQDRLKLDLLLSLQLHGGLEKRRSLEEVMDELSRQAKANGMTPETLQAILDA